MMVSIKLYFFIPFATVQLSFQAPLHVQKQQTEDYVDSGCSEDQVSKCEAQSYTNCTSLKDAILNTYDYQYGVRLPSDIPYHIFSAFDLLYSGLIPDELQTNPRDAVLKTTRWRDLAHDRCHSLLGQIKLSTKDTNECRWRYTCKYNPHYFPSFTVEAELDTSLSVEHRCRKIRLEENIKFVRTTCKANPQEDHWCTCDVGPITTGYKHRS